MKTKILTIIISILIIAISLIFFINSKFLFILISLAIIIGAAPFLISFLSKESKEKEKEEMFLEFSRNLVETVKAGTPISKSIIGVSDKTYGSLTEYTKKLASQVSLGIPVRQALQTFASDVNNRVISRSVALIIQAESSGGEIGSVLDAIVTSVSQIEEIKKERASRVYSMILQGYIIFLIFLVIMIFVQVKFMPLIAKAFIGSSIQEVNQGTNSSDIINRAFFILILLQSFFAGLVIGKLSENSIKAGIKHSAILLIISLLTLGISRIL